MEYELGAGVVVGGDYRILRPLAAGGMGAVYVAEQISTARRRALKVLRSDLAGDPAVAERFVLEARVAARIQSDHVVEVIAAGIDPAVRAPWLAMELLEGWSLEQLVRERGRLPPPEAAALLGQLGAGLAAAHRAGVVHRDLKPENVFVANSLDGSRPVRVKILDFGIAKVVAEAAAGGSATMAVGTPRWMAPEQTDSLSIVSPATDVWAFGLLVYYTLTGRPFWRAASGAPGTNVSQLLRELLADPIPLASARAAEQGVGEAIPRGLDAWLACCLERDPGRRYPDGGTAAAALAQVLGPGRLDAAAFGGGARFETGPPASLSGTSPTMAVTGRNAPRRATSAWIPALVGIALLLLGATAAALVLGFIAFPLQQRVTAASASASAAASSSAPVAETPPSPSGEISYPVVPPASGAPPPPVPASIARPDLDGDWTIRSARTPEGTTYGGVVGISTLGAAKIVQWRVPAQVIQGIGRVDGDRLDVAYGSVGYALGVYRIQGGVLRGRLVDAAAPDVDITERLRGPASLEGTFAIEESSVGAVGSVIVGRHGSRLVFTRATAVSSLRGIGIRQGDRIVVAYSQHMDAGVVTYALARDGKSMDGVWAGGLTPATGAESLARP